LTFSINHLNCMLTFTDIAPDKPFVWVLLGEKGGDNQQLRNLARLLAWPWSEKQLIFNRLARRPNVFLGPTLLSLDKNRSSALAPPWPALIITSGRRSVPAARWVKKQSGGKTKLVHVGRPWGPLRWFDLIITTAQYCLPRRMNVIHNTLPMVEQNPRQLRREAAKWLDTFQTFPRPWIALLAGGPSRPLDFDEASGIALGQAASAFASERGGSLFVTASRRCPPPIFGALTDVLNCPAFIHYPHGTKENPYLAYLQLADMFIVTNDSASMIADACLTQKVVMTYDLPSKPDRKMRIANLLKNILVHGESAQTTIGKKQPRSVWIYQLLVDSGLLTSTRDMRSYTDNLENMGLIMPFGADAPCQQMPQHLIQAEIEATLSRIKALFA